jgi:hypothetical protein
MRPTVTAKVGDPNLAVELKSTLRPRQTQPLSPHAVEREVHRRLSTHPGLRLESLVVHRTPAGVCLEGRAELLGPDLDLRAVLKDIDGVDEVINRLMPATPCLDPGVPCVDELMVDCYQG